MPLTGLGYLAGEMPGGRTTIEGVPTVAEVRVYFEEANGDWTLAGSTTSAPNGTWLVNNLNPALTFHVVGRKSGYPDVLHSGVRPIPTDSISITHDLRPNAALNGMAGSGLLVGGLPPYTVSVASGVLPYGLTPVVDNRTLIVDGVSSDEGEWSAVLRIASSNAVTEDAPVTSVVIVGDAFTASLPSAINGSAYSGVLSARSFLSSPITWTIVSGSMPTGLSIGGGTVTADISGTPSDDEGVYSFRVRMESHTGASFEKDCDIFLSASAPMEPEALALFSRMTVAPSEGRKNAINNFIAALKNSGIWSTLDYLHVMAAHVQQAAMLNWVNASAYNLTPVGSPTFVTDVGFSGNGSNMALSIGDISTGTNSSASSVFFGCFTFNAVAGHALTGSDDYARTHKIIPIQNASSGLLYLGGNDRTDAPWFNNTSSVGFFSASRQPSDAQYKIYKDGVFVSNVAHQVNWPVNLSYLRQLHYESWRGYTYSQGNVAIGVMGSGLSSVQVNEFYEALNDYILSLGGA